MAQATKAAITGLALVLALAGCERELVLEGERLPVRTDVNAESMESADPALNEALPIALPAPRADAEWTHRGGDARHAGGHGMLSPQPQLVWAAQIGQGNSRQNRIAASPVVFGGLIFTMDALDRVQATSTSGAPVWSANLTAAFDRGGNLSGGGLAVEAGRLFATTAYGELIALDAGTGQVVWRQRFDSPATGAPTVSQGVVYAVGRDGSAFAVDAADGKVRWMVPGAPSATGVMGAAGPAITDRSVILPFTSGGLVGVLKQTGYRLWDAPVTGQRFGRGYQGLTDITGDPVVVGERIYVGTAAGRTAAIDAASGARIWTATEGAMNPPLVVGGSVFVVNDEARLVRLDAETGALIWAVEMPYWDNDKPRKRKAITAHYGPVLAGGRLVVAGGDGQLRLFDPASGTMTGGVAIPGGAASAPALAGGMLYVVNGAGQLLAFR